MPAGSTGAKQQVNVITFSIPVILVVHITDPDQKHLGTDPGKLYGSKQIRIRNTTDVHNTSTPTSVKNKVMHNAQKRERDGKEIEHNDKY